MHKHKTALEIHGRSSNQIHLRLRLTSLYSCILDRHEFCLLIEVKREELVNLNLAHPSPSNHDIQPGEREKERERERPYILTSLL